jgi:hypothetical protein
VNIDSYIRAGKILKSLERRIILRTRKMKLLVFKAVFVMVFLLSACVQNTLETQSTVTPRNDPATVEIAVTVEQSRDLAEESAAESSLIVTEVQVQSQVSVSNEESPTITGIVAPTPRPVMVATNPATVRLVSDDVLLSSLPFGEVPVVPWRPSCMG